MTVLDKHYLGMRREIPKARPANRTGADGTENPGLGNVDVVAVDDIRAQRATSVLAVHIVTLAQFKRERFSGRKVRFDEQIGRAHV